MCVKELGARKVEGEPKNETGGWELGLHASPCFGGRRLVSPTVSHKHAPNRRARFDA